MILLWSALNDRPRCWALDEANWRFDERPEHLLSEGQLSRRVRDRDVLRQFRRILERLNETLGKFSPRQARTAIADGSPLPVGGASSDPDARAGRAARGMARGYKLHLVSGEFGAIFDFRITAMNTYEGHPLVDMLQRVPATIARVVADGNYDSSPIHRACDARDMRFIAPVKNNRVGRRNCPFRKSALKYLNTPRGIHEFRKRANIERLFGQLKSSRFGLQGLPSWVRRLPRVKLWVIAKLIFYSANRIRIIKNRSN
jgi:hypothetical protein